MYKHLPNFLSVCRIALVPWLVIAIITGKVSAALTLLLLASLTDWIDGRLARRFNATSHLGEHLDVIADFIVILATFTAFVFVGFYSYWIPVIVIFMLILFYITSGGMKLQKDSIGKYYGAFLYLAAITTLLVTDTRWYQIVSVLIITYSMAVVGNRLYGYCSRPIN